MSNSVDYKKHSNVYLSYLFLYVKKTWDVDKYFNSVFKRKFYMYIP